MSHFGIVCRACGKELINSYCAFCEHCQNALLVTKYKDDFIEAESGGIWRFNWLPVHGDHEPAPGPVVYKSEALSARLGLKELYIAFNGYWPERGAELLTCTFKEYEALVVMENARDNGIEGLVVASAGNTARAFAHLSVTRKYPVIIVVPLMCLSEMWYLESSSLVPTFIVSDGDYSDAIDLAKRISLIAGMPFEGGVKNIAKRDGLGLVMLESVSRMARLPDHYFQAVGSGAGAVAAWEMSERFIRDGRFGGVLPKLHLAQNLPFAPMFKAWSRGMRELDKNDLNPELICQISTRVLSTRYPAYSIKGGVYDALTASKGSMYGVTNEEMSESKDMFKAVEGIDLVPASAVAVAALKQAVSSGAIGKTETVLLNITGGGEERLKQVHKPHRIEGESVSKKITDSGMEDLLCKKGLKTGS